MLSEVIPELGLFCLIMSLGFSALLSFTPLIDRFFPTPVSRKFSASFALGQMAFVTFSFLALAWAFYTDDFSVVYVAHNSNAKLPTPYKLSAIWGGHEGSMLLWYIILCFWTSLFCLNKSSNDDSVIKIKSAALMVLGLLGVGFSLFLLITSNPFARYLPEVPLEGADLNPLLQDFGLIIHPPILYLGYVGFAIPFAIAMGALWRSATPSEIVKLMRSWSLAAWAFLTLGIALGSWWAYYELGWGGWWFWDPVENASLMPWLVGVALIHMIKATSKTDILPKWTLLLALVCFSLSLLGTFLVRSGVLSSVHAFATDPLRGQFILKFLVCVIGGALFLYLWRAPKLDFFKSKTQTLFSREGLIFFGSIILFVLMLTVLLGTLYPIAIDAILNTKLSVGPPYFNAIFIPFVSLLFIVMGIAPHIKWMKDTPNQYVRLIVMWTAMSVALSVLLPIIFNWGLKPKLVLGLFLSLWLVVTTLALALKRLKNKNLMNQSFLSMALAHLGVAMCVAGIALTTHLEVEKDLAMHLGESVSVGGYQFHLNTLKEIEGSNYQGVQAEMEITQVSKGKDRYVKTLYPEKRFYIPREMPLSETAIDPGFFRDLYVALGEPLSSERWSMRIYVKPFVRWLWLGAILMAAGGFLAIFKWPIKQSRLQ